MASRKVRRELPRRLGVSTEKRRNCILDFGPITSEPELRNKRCKRYLAKKELNLKTQLLVGAKPGLGEHCKWQGPANLISPCSHQSREFQMSRKMESGYGNKMILTDATFSTFIPLQHSLSRHVTISLSLLSTKNQDCTLSCFEPRSLCSYRGLSETLCRRDSR